MRAFALDERELLATVSGKPAAHRPRGGVEALACKVCQQGNHRRRLRTGLSEDNVSATVHFGLPPALQSLIVGTHADTLALAHRRLETDFV
jgi:hypothetical protein